MSPSEIATRNLNARRIYWGGVLIWAVVCYFIGSQISNNMTFRINDLASAKGTGMIMRDPEGMFFHVNTDGSARPIYPTLAPEGTRNPCVDCVLVTGDQMSKTNDFCVAAVPNQLPKIKFEVPCKSWAVISDGRTIVSITLFLVPLLLWPIFRGLARAAMGLKPI